MDNSELKFNVVLDENKLPVAINWEAEGSGVEGVQQAKALFVSVWDKKEGNTLRIDLWTKDMLVDEMKVFFYQSLLSMADTFERATNESELAGEMRGFAMSMGEKMDLIRKK